MKSTSLVVLGLLLGALLLTQAPLPDAVRDEDAETPASKPAAAPKSASAKPAATDAAQQRDAELLAAIETVLNEYVAAFNQHDAQALADYWSETGVYVDEASGERITGREAIQADLAQLFEQNGQVMLAVSLENVRVIRMAESAAELATVPPPADEAAAEAAEWLPLGTFAVSTNENEGEPTRFIQLAVSHEGIISGTYYNSQTDVAQTVIGQVDPDTQRVAMRLSDDELVVAETGLYNLTLDEAPVLVHFGPDKFEFFLLVRMDPPAENGE